MKPASQLPASPESPGAALAAFNRHMEACEKPAPRTGPRESKNPTKGVGWHAGHKRWQAWIVINRRLKHLGFFGEYSDAVNARRYAERDLEAERAASLSR